MHYRTASKSSQGSSIISSGSPAICLYLAVLAMALVLPQLTHALVQAKLRCVRPLMGDSGPNCKLTINNYSGYSPPASIAIQLHKTQAGGTDTSMVSRALSDHSHLTGFFYPQHPHHTRDKQTTMRTSLFTAPESTNGVARQGRSAIFIALYIQQNQLKTQAKIS